MKKLVFGACALTLTGGIAAANETDWSQLDQDVQALSASVQGLEGTGLVIGGRIRAAYENSGDIAVNAMEDLGGFGLYNARLFATGTTANNIGYRFEYDFAGGTSTAGGASGSGVLLDAYLDIPVGADISIRAGQFRGFVLNESQIDSGNLFFFDRSVNAAAFAGRTNGLAVAGDFDAFNWGVTVQNGSSGIVGDSVGDDLFYAVRGGIALLGEGTQAMEGAFGASEEMEASAGVAYFNNDSFDDGDGFAVEAALASSQFSVQANLLSAPDDIGALAGNADFAERGTGLGALIIGDGTPWSLQGTFMLTQPNSDYGAWEIGLRYQDLDDAANTDAIDVGANYYVDGHNMKYIINWTSIGSDLGDIDLIRIGVNTRI